MVCELDNSEWLFMTTLTLIDTFNQLLSLNLLLAPQMGDPLMLDLVLLEAI